MRTTTMFASTLLWASICGATCAGSSPLATGFINPPSDQRPRFRYWVRDSSVDAATINKDIKAAGSVGAGGVEFLPFFEYGGFLGTPPASANWTAANFGTPAFHNIFLAALEAHSEAGMIMDFALGPNQGQGISSPSNNDGLQWGLVPYMIDVPFGESLNGTIPGWGSGELVSVVSSVVLSTQNITYVTPGNLIFPSKTVSYEVLVLQNSSLVEVSDKLSAQGVLNATFQQVENGTHYKVFAFYQKLSGNKNLYFPNNASNSIWDNGSYVVDHFSAKGAYAVKAFWEENIMSDEIVKLLTTAGRAGWEDSLEIESTINWSPNLLSKFNNKFGYDLRTFLPLMIFKNNNINMQANQGDPGSADVSLGTDDQGAGFINDFRSILTDGYIEYVNGLKEWLHSYGLKLRNQPIYNLPMDMRAGVINIDIPECESLDFNDNVDSYRQFSGAANLAGRNIVSNELGAVSTRAYSLTIPDLLRSMNRAVSGGVNHFVIHGQAFSGNYTETTWPGHTAFGYRYFTSELWSPKRPDWDHGLKQALEHMGRVQYFQQQGTPRTDVAIYDKQSYVDQKTNLFNGTDLNDMLDEGWHYTYLSPEQFSLDAAYVKENVLTPEGPRYQAIVVPSYENFTLDAVEQLRKYADRGLPVILIGGSQGYYPTAGGSSKAAVEEALSDLKKRSGVNVVSDGEVVEKLRLLGLKPRVAIETTGTWRTTLRQDASTRTDFAYIFNDGPASSGVIKVNSTGQPFTLMPEQASKSHC